MRRNPFHRKFVAARNRVSSLNRQGSLPYPRSPVSRPTLSEFLLQVSQPLLPAQHGRDNHRHRCRSNQAKGKLYYPLGCFLVVVKLLVKPLDFLLQLPNFSNHLLRIASVVCCLGHSKSQVDCSHHTLTIPTAHRMCSSDQHPRQLHGTLRSANASKLIHQNIRRRQKPGFFFASPRVIPQPQKPGF